MAEKLDLASYKKEIAVARQAGGPVIISVREQKALITALEEAWICLGKIQDQANRAEVGYARDGDAITEIVMILDEYRAENNTALGVAREE